MTVAALVALTACGDDDGTMPGIDAGGSTDGGGGNCTTQMFDRYGETAFLAVNDSIIANAVAAPTAELGTTFQDLAAAGDTRVEEFRGNLAAFLVMVYGGPSGYTGPSMEAVHSGLGITSAQYDYFVTEVVVPSLVENGVPTSDINDCFAPPLLDPAFKASIVEE